MAHTAYLDAPLPLAMAHRGFSANHPENSMAAFAAAVDLGFDYVETDVHATADGVLLAFHDDTLDRVTDHSGAIHSRLYRDIKGALIDGIEPIATFDDLLGAWPDLRINIDVKAAPAIVPLVAAIERHKAHERICITSFSDRRRIAALRRLSCPVATSGGQARTAGFVVAQRLPARALARAAAYRLDALQVPVSHAGIPIVTERSVQRAHAAGLQVHVWTVNEADQMRQLLDIGVDGLITDRADVLKAVLAERGRC